MSHEVSGKAPKPDYDNLQQESTGAVTSDSLAAESVQAGGAFNDNADPAVQSVKGSNSTFNTTDTSGATVLAPAASGAEREEAATKGLGSDERGAAGEKLYSDGKQPEFDGVHSQEGYVGGSGQTTSMPAQAKDEYSGATGDSFADGVTTSTGSDSSAAQTTSGSSSAPKSSTTTGTSGTSGSSSSNADDAPTYAAAIVPPGSQQPKGTNLTEGGIPATKTFVGNVGGDKDPGRDAERDFEAVQARVAGVGVNDTKPVESENSFDVLESERAPDANN